MFKKKKLLSALESVLPSISAVLRRGESTSANSSNCLPLAQHPFCGTWRAEGLGPPSPSVSFSNRLLLPQSSETQHTVRVQGRHRGAVLGNCTCISLFTGPYPSSWWRPCEGGPARGAQGVVLPRNVYRIFVLIVESHLGFSRGTGLSWYLQVLGRAK